MARDKYPPVENVARFKMLGTANDGVDDHEIQNSLYFVNQTSWDSAGLITFGLALAAEWKDHIMALLSVEYTLNEVNVKDLTDPANVPLSLAVSEVGEVTGESLPYSACAVAKLPGTVAVRPTYGYLRLGPLGESQARGNHLTTTARSALETAVRAFVVDANAIDAAIDMVVVAVVLAKDDDPVPPNIFMDEGEWNPVGIATVRRRLGRSVSRLQ